MESITISKNRLVSKDELLRIKLIDFYSKAENLNILLPIILQQTRLSLRSLDWFVTNYCKKYNINYILTRKNDQISYFPFKAYKSQLKAYSKKYCDPFCRRERIIYNYQDHTILDYSKDNIPSDHKDYIITTIGQLNFFRFAIQDNIINYAVENIEDIEKDMNSTLKTRESEKKFMEVKSIKRKELSVPGNKSVHFTRISAVIRFV
jgi:hypothetical protein